MIKRITKMLEIGDLFNISNLELKYNMPTTLSRLSDSDLMELFLFMCTAYHSEELRYSGGKNHGNAYNAIGRLVTRDNKSTEELTHIGSRLKRGNTTLEFLELVKQFVASRNGKRYFKNGNMYVETMAFFAKLEKQCKAKEN